MSGGVADDGEWRRVDTDRFSDDRFVAAEIATPQLLAEHRDIRCACLVLAFREEAAGKRRDSEQREPVGVDANALHALSVRVVTREIRRRSFDDRDTDETR